MTDHPERSMPADDQGWACELHTVLKRQDEAVRTLVGLVRRQGELVEKNAADSLHNLLARRRSIIAEVQQDQTRIIRLTDGADDRLADVPGETGQAIRELMQSIRGGLAEVMDRDAEDEAAIIARRDEARDELARVAPGRKAHQAYTGKPEPGPRFEDGQA
ncbi:MAG: hypothetical protein AB8G96_13055 [Phycisphaerales bacterium]